MRNCGTAALGLATVALLAGCSLLPSPEGEVVADVFSLEVGDCLNDGGSEGAISSVPKVDCSEPHDSEAFTSILLEDGAYPDPEILQSMAQESCVNAFGAFAGIAWEDSRRLYLSWYTPTEAGWEDGDREVLCTIMELDAEGNKIKTTGTLEGANK